MSFVFLHLLECWSPLSKGCRSVRHEGDLLPNAVWSSPDSDSSGLFAAISELPSVSFVTIFENASKLILGYCPAGRPMTSSGEAALTHCHQVS